MTWWMDYRPVYDPLWGAWVTGPERELSYEPLPEQAFQVAQTPSRAFGEPAMTRVEIGRVLGLSSERIRQIEQSGLRKLRVRLEKEGHTFVVARMRADLRSPGRRESHAPTEAERELNEHERASLAWLAKVSA